MNVYHHSIIQILPSLIMLIVRQHHESNISTPTTRFAHFPDIQCGIPIYNNGGHSKCHPDVWYTCTDTGQLILLEYSQQYVPANNVHCAKVVLMFGQLRRRLPNFITILVQCIVFAGAKCKFFCCLFYD